MGRNKIGDALYRLVSIYRECMCLNFGASAGNTFQGTGNIRRELSAQNVYLQIINCWRKAETAQVQGGEAQWVPKISGDLKSRERGRAGQSS